MQILYFSLMFNANFSIYQCVLPAAIIIVVGGYSNGDLLFQERPLKL